MAAGIARSASNPDSDVHAYNLLLNRGGSMVAIDSSAGEVISDPSALTSFLSESTDNCSENCSYDACVTICI
jgi:hypothetical protein